MGRQFKPGQIQTGSLYNISASYALTASYAPNYLPLTGGTITGPLNISGNTTITGSITAINQTASFGYVSSSFIDVTGKQTVRGYLQFYPTADVVPITETGSYIYSSGSEGDMYFAQTNGTINNVIRLRWLEGNMYSGLLNGGVISTQSATIYQVSSGSGLIVSLNGSLNSDPYPAVQYLTWPNLSASIAPLSASFDQSFVAIKPTGSEANIFVQGLPYDDGQFNTLIPIGNVIHQNRSTINAVATYPSVAYGYKQRSSDFIRAFGPLKLSGLNTIVSGSTTGSLQITSGTSYNEGRNYVNDVNNPSYVTDTGQPISKIFRYYQSGSAWVYLTNGGAGFETIDPTQYSLNGVLTPVPGTGANRQFSIQRVYYFPGGATKGIYVYYGNTTYTSAVDAIANIPYENFTEAPNTAAGAVLSAYLVVRNNANFTVPESYNIRPGGLFRNIGGSGGGGAAVTQTLASLTDVNVLTPPPTDGQPLAYNATTLKWENRTYISASLAGNASTATTASYALTASYLDNYIPPFPYTGSALITGSLGVTGSVSTRAPGALSTDIAFRVRNSADTANLFYVTGLGGVFSHGSTGITSNIVYGSNTALQFSTGADNIAIGNGLRLHTNGSRNVAIGNNLVLDSNGDDCVAIGNAAGNGGATQSTLIGSGGSGTFTRSVKVGFNAASFVAATDSIFIGNSAGTNYNGGGVNTVNSQSVIIGGIAKTLANSDVNEIVIGYNATGIGSNTVTLGNNSILTTALKGNVGIGTTSPSAKLDVKAQGALSTDIALRVRNSADTQNSFIIDGLGQSRLKSTGYTPKFSIGYDWFGADRDAFIFTQNIQNFRGQTWTFDAGYNGNNEGLKIYNDLSGNDTGIIALRQNNLLVGFDTATPTVADRRTLVIYNGVSPTAGRTDGVKIYSADITAGNAAPHFFTEAGNIVKLYTQPAVTSSQGIADALTNLGFLTGSSIIATTNPFPYTGSALITGSLGVTGSVSITKNSTTTGPSLTVYGSGSAQPVFTVQGSQGELFSITDSLSGSLFSVNDISGLPIMEVFSDNTILMGNYQDPMLVTTAKVTQTNSGSFTVYSLPTASYDTAFFEYSVRSGSNARAGSIMAIQSGSAVNFTETTTTEFGSTSAISFTVIVTGSNMALTGSSTSGAWTIKTIVRGI